MQPALRNQLAHLDRALMAMLNERARLLASVPLDDSGRSAATSDLLRRHDGPFHAQKLKLVFELIDAGCAGEDSRFATCETNPGSAVASPSTLGPRVEGEK
ncbi:MAG: hypothetical protein H8E15_10930 [Planctomycetes bacterium]|nr:hypothetical protein [Planctomycetota bacterium]